MAVKDLYTYKITVREENRIEASLRVNPEHPIYKGHFPGLPVTPGVCQVEMIRELLQGEVKSPLILSRAKQLKFAAVHEPEKEPEIRASISFSKSGDLLEVRAQLEGKEKIFLKFKGEFRKQS